MDMVIYFDNENQTEDRCAGQVYFDYLDYAFAKCDYFMLVYVDYYGEGYTEKQCFFKRALEDFTVKIRTNPSWPGTPAQEIRNTTYDIVFYKATNDAKAILKSVSCLSAWSRPHYPEDLAFFIGNKCWAYSVGHEKIAAIIHANEADLDFVESNGLARRASAFIPEGANYEYYKSCDELLE